MAINGGGENILALTHQRGFGDWVLLDVMRRAGSPWRREGSDAALWWR
jgi:hypothetical protein